MWDPWLGPKPISVRLSDADWQAAEAYARAVVEANGGAREYVDHRTIGFRDPVVPHHRGKAAEIAAAHVTGLAGPSFEVLTLQELREGPKRPDIGQRTDVKQTARHDGRLRLYVPDRRDFIFLLVTGIGPQFLVHGWAWGQVVKDERRWRESGWTWSLPQMALLDLELLPIDA